MILPWESSESSTEVTTTDNNSIQAILETQRTKIRIVMTMPNLWQPYFFLQWYMCYTKNDYIWRSKLQTIKHSNTHTQIFIYTVYINYMLFIQHLDPTNRGRSSGLVPFDGLLFCEFRSKRAETTQHLQGCDCRVPWETHKIEKN